jgi:RHS repeat-associated protein
MRLQRCRPCDSAWSLSTITWGDECPRRYQVYSDANGNITGLYCLDRSLPLVAGKVHAQDQQYQLIGTLDYDAFGNTVTNTLPPNQAVCPMGFSSKYQDSETGLAYYGFRYYSPELGRWLNRDPIAERGGLNLYGMVGNDTVSGVDYLGLAPTKQSDCLSEIRAGHGSTNKVPGTIEEIPPSTKPGDRCTGVSCFSGHVNQRLPGAVDYPGQKYNDPEVPDYWRDPNPQRNPNRRFTPNPNEPGYLPGDQRAYDSLVSAIKAAAAQARKDCDAEPKCCKSITVKVWCQNGAGIIDFQKVTSRLGKPVLCGKSWTYDCKTKAWKPAEPPN